MVKCSFNMDLISNYRLFYMIKIVMIMVSITLFKISNVWIIIINNY